ncbi:MAG: hypothetical protein JNM67_08865 [Bacteroidetes bacterium]|nr:hypothetical protein [Bacteroidota bacterium]
MEKTYHLYISYSWQCHIEACKKKIEFLEKSGLKYKFLEAFKMEIGPDDSEDLHIEKTIKFSDCLLMIAGVDEQCDEKLEMEVNLAKKHKKPIIAIAPWDNKKKPCSYLIQNADKVIGWHAKPLAEAIVTLV